MDWLNLRVSALRSPQYLGSRPVERATWIGVLAYCVDQENGGIVVGAASWKTRQWQQVCGVTAREVRAASKLLAVVENDVVVFGYPKDKEREVQARRLQAGDAARRRWEKELGLKGDAPRNASRIPPRNAEGEGELELPLNPQGDLDSSNGLVSESDQPKKRWRSPERRLAKAREELETVEREMQDILRPGGCAYNVQPTGDKSIRFEGLKAQHAKLLAAIEQARTELTELEPD